MTQHRTRLTDPKELVGRTVDQFHYWFCGQLLLTFTDGTYFLIDVRHDFDDDFVISFDKPVSDASIRIKAGITTQEEEDLIRGIWPKI